MATITLTDDYSPHYVGDLSQPFEHQFVDHSGAPFDLTAVVAANMTLILFCPDTAQRKIGGGTWAIPTITQTQGIAVYSWGAADVADGGIFQMQAGVPFSAGMQHFDIKEIEFIQPL
jgi:hypothetical protein